MTVKVLPDFVVTVSPVALAHEAAMTGRTQEQVIQWLAAMYRDGLAKKHPNAVFGVKIKVEQKGQSVGHDRVPSDPRQPDQNHSQPYPAGVPQRNSRAIIWPTFSADRLRPAPAAHNVPAATIRPIQLSASPTLLSTLVTLVSRLAICSSCSRMCSRARPNSIPVSKSQRIRHGLSPRGRDLLRRLSFRAKSIKNLVMRNDLAAGLLRVPRRA